MRSITKTQVTWKCSVFWGDVTFLDPDGCFHVFRSCCHVATKITQIHKPQKMVGSCRARCCMCHHVPQHDSITVQNMLGVLRTMSYRSSCHQGDMWDAQLTSKGEEQAAELKPLMSREHVDLVVSSLVSQVERLLCASKIFLSSHPWYVMLPVFMTCAMAVWIPWIPWIISQLHQLQGSPLTRAIQTGLLASPPGIARLPTATGNGRGWTSFSCRVRWTLWTSSCCSTLLLICFNML